MHAYTASVVRRLSDRIRGEAGFALPTVLGVVVASLALSSAAAFAAMASLQGTTRDSDSKTALGAADAGVSSALARQNLIAGADPTSSACLYEGNGGLLYSQGIEADGWCAPVEGTVGGATYSYRTRPNADETMDVVAIGTSDGVDRRVLLRAKNSNGANIFAKAGLIGLDGITASGNATAYTGAASNGNIVFNNSSYLCGPATAANPLPQHHGGGQCPEGSYPYTSEPVSLPAVQQGNAPTENKNDEITKAKAGQPSEVLIAGNANKVSWDPATRQLSLLTKSTVTLSGGTYSLCSLNLESNTNLYVNAGSQVRIFFDDPDNCSGLNTSNQPVVQFAMSSNSQIGSTAADASDLALLFVGSQTDTVATKVQLASNLQGTASCQNDLIIYGPKTNIDVNSNNTFCGAIAGKTINLASNIKFISGDTADEFELPGAGPHYVIESFVECSATTTGATAAGC